MGLKQTNRSHDHGGLSVQSLVETSLQLTTKEEQRDVSFELNVLSQIEVWIKLNFNKLSSVSEFCSAQPVVIVNEIFSSCMNLNLNFLKLKIKSSAIFFKSVL